MSSLRVDGLPCGAASIPSGFAFRELPSSATNLAPNGSFEAGTPPQSWSWTNDANGAWSLDAEAAEGSRSLKLSIPGPAPKRGPALLSNRFRVRPNTVYTLAFQTKSRRLEGNLTAYAVEQDSAGKWSQRGVNGVTGTAGWTRRSLSYTSGATARLVYLKIEVYRGHGTVWVDDIGLRDPFGGRSPAGFRGRVSSGESGAEFVAAASELRLDARFRSLGPAIQVDVLLEDRTGRDRAIELSFGLPIDAVGWSWEESFVGRTSIAREARYENLSTGYGPRGYSVYPFASVTGRGVSLSLAVPPTPQLARLTYDAASGLRVSWDLGLSPAARKTPSRAAVKFWIYRQAPKWGYRAAAEKYYALNRERFTSKFAPVGSWVLTGTREFLSTVANWRDFGWGWIETVGNIQFGSSNGLPSLHYLDPWGWFQGIPGHPKPSLPPPYATIVGSLRSWAREGGGSTVDGAPVREMAQAVLNSSPYDQEGRYQIKARAYFWYGQRLQIYPVSADPEIPAPSMWSVTKKHSVDNRMVWARSKGHLLGGFFLDDLTDTFGGVENHRRELWAYSDVPLSFSLTAQRPVLFNGSSMAECAEALRSFAHANGMTLAGSMDPASYVWFAPHLDIVGGEVRGAEAADRAYLRRALGYGKALTNLLVPPRGAGAPDQEQVLAFLRQGLLLGYFPGFPESYWRDAKALERDRPLFKRYIPLIRETVKAGWQPVNFVTTSDPAVFVERFGDGSAGVFYFSAQNSGSSPAKVLFTVDGASLDIGSDNPELVELLSGSVVPFSREHADLRFSHALGRGESAVFRLTPAKRERPARGVE